MIHLLADSTIASGHTWAADLLFLIAAILFGWEAIAVALATRGTNAVVVAKGLLSAVGLCLVALAWFLL